MLRRYLRLRRERDIGIHQTFHKNRAIFIHIPKAAGSAISHVLFGHQVGHYSIAELKRRDPVAVKDYFKFTFVREPLDRLHSAFCFLQAGGMNEVDRNFAQTELSGLDFPAFVERLAEDDSLLRWMHFRPQSEFLLIEYMMGVNFVGRFENLEADYATVARILGREDVVLPKRNSGPLHAPNVDSRINRLVHEIYAQDYQLLNY